MAEYGLMGSVTAEVIERSPVFVYSIPEEAGPVPTLRKYIKWLSSPISTRGI